MRGRKCQPVAPLAHEGRQALELRPRSTTAPLGLARRHAALAVADGQSLVAVGPRA